MMKNLWQMIQVNLNSKQNIIRRKMINLQLLLLRGCIVQRFKVGKLIERQ